MSTSERSSSKWWAAVTIEHEVGGKTYRRLDKGPSLNLSADVARDLPKVGTTIGCSYVDGHPDLVTIFPGKPTSTGALLAFAGFCFLLPFLLHFLNERQKRRAG